MAGTRRIPLGLLAVWAATRLTLLLFVLKVWVFPGPDVTSDVSVIYRGWYDVLRTGVFPSGDVSWQYPPGAALAILSPALLPFLDYAHAFFVLAFLTDLAVLGLLLYAGARDGDGGRPVRGAWLWTVGVALLGPTVYARYDVMVTAVAVGALVAGARRPRVLGALAGVGALVKGWPVLLLVGVVRRRAWGAAAVVAGGLALVFAVAMPGAFSFLGYQSRRGTEVESLGALVFHVARHAGWWRGEVLLNYGSVEFLGPWVGVVSSGAMFLSVVGVGWLVLWRLSVRRVSPHTFADAAFVAVLVFTVTSRVISPQYLVWLVGLGAVCLCCRGSRMAVPAVLVLVACPVTVLEFPLYFAEVVASDGVGVALLVVRNGLLVCATVIGARALWRDAVSSREELFSPPPPLPVPTPGASPRTPEGLRSSPRP
ncbi:MULTISPECIES: glycosyltransferase family 87 protein [unclassified Streptomyces]|uniref:glycosyltransferase family 87 protein n=1 Tax=unclassified Streptomyces TaxID=2593676 RepID=UPI00068E82E5|nr:MULTISPECIES: glycosyltransferase family 87 protein [unclassified Streptomyces]